MSKVNPGKFSALGDPVQALGLKTSVGFVRLAVSNRVGSRAQGMDGCPVQGLHSRNSDLPDEVCVFRV